MIINGTHTPCRWKQTSWSAWVTGSRGARCAQTRWTVWSAQAASLTVGFRTILSRLLTSHLVYCNTKDNPLQTSGFPINVRLFLYQGRMLYAYFEKNKIRPTNSTTCYPSPHHTRPTPGLSPSWAPLPVPLSKSGCQATTSRTPPVGMPSPFARSSACTGSSTTAPSSRQWHSPRSRRRRRRRCCQRGRTPADSHRLPGQLQRQAPPTATQLPSFGIQAESGVPLGVFQLSGPAGPAAPEVRHPYPAPCHGAAHQELSALQGPASALRQHGVRGAAPASPPPATQGHCRRLHSSSGDE